MISELVDIVLSRGEVTANFRDVLVSDIRGSIPQIPVTKHPLGFVHYDLSQLAKLPSGGFARLHIWDSELAPPDPAGNIHDHTWNLTSAILAGSLRDRTFLPRANAKGAFTAVQVRYGENNRFEGAGRYDLVPQSDRVVRQGEIYTIPSRIVHESEPLENPTITFVVGIPDENAEASGPLILSPSAGVSAGTAKRQAVSQAEALTLLERV